MSASAIAYHHHHHHGHFSKNQGIPQSINFSNLVSAAADGGNTASLNNNDTQQTTIYEPSLLNQKKSGASCGGNEKKSEDGCGKRGGISRSVLAGKYLVFVDEKNLTELQSDSGSNPISPNNNTPTQLRPTKAPLKCVKLATKEWMQCKITLRDDRGVNTLAAHQRLGECAEYVNPISELLVTPKYFCLVSPGTYGNLHSYIYSKTTLKESEAKHLFKQMVSIVEFCHSKGIILRDLKLGKFVFTDKERTNIKLESLEDVVVLPHPESDDDSLDDRRGCPNYVSPEKTECVMKSGTKYRGKASDVWSLGVSLYAMLAGRYPFNDSDCSRLLHKIRSGMYPMVEGISPVTKSLIRCLLTKNPLDRPSCRELAKHPWFRTEDFQSVPTVRAPAAVRSREEFERDACKAKRMRLNDDQVVPGSD